VVWHCIDFKMANPKRLVTIAMTVLQLLLLVVISSVVFTQLYVTPSEEEIKRVALESLEESLTKSVQDEELRGELIAKIEALILSGGSVESLQSYTLALVGDRGEDIAMKAIKDVFRATVCLIGPFDGGLKVDFPQTSVLSALEDHTLCYSVLGVSAVSLVCTVVASTVLCCFCHACGERPHLLPLDDSHVLFPSRGRAHST
jgi:hypothetical protein